VPERRCVLLQIKVTREHFIKRRSHSSPRYAKTGLRWDYRGWVDLRDEQFLCANVDDRFSEKRDWN
jgi:hypothetical protein